MHSNGSKTIARGLRSGLVVALATFLTFTVPGHESASAQGVSGQLPSIEYSSFLASSDFDESLGVAFTPDGKIVVVGWTSGTDFPIRNAYRPSNNFFTADGFIAKIDPTQSGDASLLFSTYVGGDDGSDYTHDVDVDSSGFIYVLGDTRSSGLQADSVIFGTAGGSDIDIFVMKLTPDGQPVHTTIIGGSGVDAGFDIEVDADGAMYVAGETTSPDFPLRNPDDDVPTGDYSDEGFLFKLAPNGQSLEYSTYIGGSHLDRATRVALGSDGSAYVLARTSSLDFPVTRSYFPIVVSYPSFAALKFGSTGQLVWSDLLGSGEADGLAVDGEGQVVVAGTTGGGNFPFVNSIRTVVEGTYDGFVMRIDASSSEVLISTLIGSPGVDDVHDMAVAPSGEVVVIGTTGSSAYPTVNGLVPFHEDFPGTGRGAEGFVTVLGSDTRTLLFSTYLGGTGEEVLRRVAINAALDVFVGGTTKAQDFPTVDAFDEKPPNALSHAFVTLFSTKLSVAPPSILRFVELEQPGKKYRIRVEGTNFQPGLSVYIGSDTTPWRKAKLTARGITLGSGRALKDRFPPGISVSVRVVNPDGGSASLGFTR